LAHFVASVCTIRPVYLIFCQVLSMLENLFLLTIIIEH